MFMFLDILLSARGIFYRRLLSSHPDIGPAMIFSCRRARRPQNTTAIVVQAASESPCCSMQLGIAN